MNLPLHMIHDIEHSFGRLLLPIGWTRMMAGGGQVRWLAWFERAGFRIVAGTFHNCRYCAIPRAAQRGGE